MALSSFIMLALMQAYRTLVTYIDRARTMAISNQRIALLAHTIERDLSCACMPQLHPEITPDVKEEGAPPTPEPKSENEEKSSEKNKDTEKEEKRREDRKKYFFTEIDDADLHKFKGQRAELLKSCNFITTTALEVYGEGTPRWVRVRYELVRTKKTHQPEYSLVRKQTTDIQNFKMKISEVDASAAAKAQPITSHTLAQGIKGMFIELSMKKIPEPKKDANPEDKKIEPEEIKAFAWGESKKTIGEMPQRARVCLELWNEARDGSEAIEFFILIHADGDYDKILTSMHDNAAMGIEKNALGALADPAVRKTSNLPIPAKRRILPLPQQPAPANPEEGSV